MTSFDLDDLTSKLKNANVFSAADSGVSFAKKSLKLDTEEDAEEVVRAIEECVHLEYLDLEGNTLGPLAAKAVAKALETKGANLKRALWKDMFTGRLKTEIPKALEYLGNGLSIANTHLVELDLSDNALGPIGVQGLAKFLASSTCYTLQELRLNNNGLGITGGKMLAQALLDCHKNSCQQGTNALALRVFIAGRNRLENEGATALASVFEKLGSLEEVVMPQNGIYHPGISALASSLSANPKLRVLNLNDNTIGFKGAQALAKALPNFPYLESLNLGDCLLKTKGGVVLAEALAIEGNHPSLTELNLSFNEIRARGASSIAEAMADKNLLESLQLDGNIFGEKGRTVLREILTSSNRIDSLCSLDEDESDEESGGETENEEEEEEEEGDNQENTSGSEEDIQITENNKILTECTVQSFLKGPTGEKLLTLQSFDIQEFVDFTKDSIQDPDTSLDVKFIEEFVRTIMKVSALCGSGYSDIRVKAENLTDVLYKELFKRALESNQLSVLNNALLVNLGLIKGEDKRTEKIEWNLEGCFKALEKICQRDYFVMETKITLKIFLEKKAKTSRSKVEDPFQESKKSLKEVLNRMQIT